MTVSPNKYNSLFGRPRIDPGFLPRDRPILDSVTVLLVRHSAAAASDSFGRAADNMKSEMRGTISDLNREPLNTP